MLTMSQQMSSPVLLLDLSFDSFSYPVAPIVSSAGDKTHNIYTHMKMLRVHVPEICCSDLPPRVN